MSFNNQDKSKMMSLKSLEETIDRAISKVEGTKENDLCKYIPVSSGGYIHHFTLRKMKTEEPAQLKDMIERYIINVDEPSTVPPKQRAPRGSRKRPNQVVFSEVEIERMRALARHAGDSELVRKLTRKKSIAACKKELISTIKNNQIVPELWNAYVESINASKSGDSDSLDSCGFGASKTGLETPSYSYS